MSVSLESGQGMSISSESGQGMSISSESGQAEQGSTTEHQPEELTRKRFSTTESVSDAQPNKRQCTPQENKDSWTYEAGVQVIPHPDKKDRQGEDAYFIGDCVFGVADGVSAWARYGIDPGKFSKRLMKEAKEVAQETRDPLEILEVAFEKTKSEEKGSCTACIVSFNGCQMNTLNLGDSGFVVYRDGIFPICSKDQQHSFNCPFQLSSRPESEDSPSDGQKKTFEVRDGDIVVLFTDGFSGNLYAEKIAKVIKNAQKPNDPQHIATQLAKEAFNISQNTEAEVPFSEDAKNQKGWIRKGGKEDDITVLVICVRKKVQFSEKEKMDDQPSLMR